MNNNVCVWGDSVLLGVMYHNNKYSLNKNFTEQISQCLNMGIKNFSRFGMTTDKAKKLFDSHSLDGGIVLLEYGGNDCNYNWELISQNPDGEHKPVVPLEEFCQNIEYMITKSKDAGCEVILSTLPPLSSDRFFNFITKDGLSKENILYWLGDIEHIYRHHERYNTALIMLAKKHNCLIADIRDSFLQCKNFKNFLCEDGMHPNLQGQQLIQKTFWSFYNNIYS